MQYVIAFLEGIITFISPCLLPMLPIYISYFAGGGQRSAGKTLKGALGFVAGFSAVCGNGRSGGHSGQLPAGVSDGGQYRIRFDRGGIWPELFGHFQAESVQRQPARRKNQ